MGLVLVTPPGSTPISLTEAKSHLRVDHSDEDTHIALLINAVTSYLDGYTGILGRCLVSQTWDLYLDEFPSGSIQIPLAPLISVSSVTYTDTSGAPQTVDSNNYTVDSITPPGWVVPDSTYSWPSTLDAVNAVKVRFVSGYSEVPAAIKAAMLLMVADLYENREPVVIGQAVNETRAVQTLLAPFRRHGI